MIDKIIVVVLSITLISCFHEPENERPNAVINGLTSQTVNANEVITLDGGKSSDGDDDLLKFEWELISKPSSSAVSLTNETRDKISFTPDKLGEYIVTLTVDDGIIRSIPVEIIILVNKLVLYENDFSDISFDGLIVDNIENTVILENEELVMNPGNAYYGKTYAVIDTDLFNSEFDNTLDNNKDNVVFSFNLSNRDATVCGSCNNHFQFLISNKYTPSSNNSFGYTLTGGGFVDDRMEFGQFANATSEYFPSEPAIVEINEGLQTQPSVGSFKLVFKSNTKTWELYFDQSTDVIDATHNYNLVGSGVDERYTSEPLRYLSFVSSVGGHTYIDNIKIYMTLDDM